MNGVYTVGQIKSLFAAMPPEMDSMPVKFEMAYTFKNWIDSMQSGHSGGGLVVAWAARKLLDHMKDNSKWRADFETAKIIMRKDGVLELRFGNIGEPVSVWFEGDNRKEVMLNLPEPPASGQGIVKR